MVGIQPPSSSRLRAPSTRLPTSNAGSSPTSISNASNSKVPLESVVIRTNAASPSSSHLSHTPSPNTGRRRIIFPGREAPSVPTAPRNANSYFSKESKGSITGDEDEDGVKATNVRVCVRMRPMLESDFAGSSLSSSAAPSIPSSLNSPTSKSRFARETKSSGFRNQTPRKGSNDASNDGSEPSSNLIPAWITNPLLPNGSHDNTTIVQSPHTLHALSNSDRTASYTFDRVYGPHDSTNILYEESLKNVVASVVEGYHGSVFCYGQTNSGKTFTMTGSVGDKSSKYGKGSKGKAPEAQEEMEKEGGEEGIVRLAVKDIFRRVKGGQASADGREYLMRVSYLEIYNEQIYDLLAVSPAQGHGPHGSHNRSSLQHHHLPPSTAVRIFESRTEGVVVRGLREEIVTCPEDVFALLDVGDAKRKVGSTGMNRSSSRSHSVFRLVLESRVSTKMGGGGGNGGSVPGLVPSSNSSVASDAGDSVATGKSSITQSLGTNVKGPVRISSLSLVDLAGSESVKMTGSTGIRQKEGQYINKSLLTLGHVVHKLSEISTRSKSSHSSYAVTEHIPYRDSKLTRLLQPSLGGNAQVCIVCNISPALANLEESHNTLKFATRAKKIQQHARITEVADEKTLLRSYREEIEELKRQLKEAKRSQEEMMALQQQQQHRTPRRERDTYHDYDGSSSDEEDQDDTHVLVSAIQNLESLILKAGASKSVKKAKEAREGGDGGSASAVEDLSMASRALESALSQAESGTNRDGESQRSGVSSHDSQGEVNKTSAPMTPAPYNRQQVGEVEEHEDEDHNLLEELHRIQGMLGAVMKKRKGGTSTLRKSTSTLANGAPSHTPARDEEVEKLRQQLQEQEFATTMRKADSSFLQGQLSEKENLLKEVSVLLDALEKRQLELEKENAQLREDLATATTLIEESVASRVKLEERLAEAKNK